MILTSTTLWNLLKKVDHLQDVDIVPMKGISFNKKHCCTEVKFKPPPYTEEDFNEIQKLAEDNIDAPEEWPTYKIKTVARASKHIIILGHICN